MKSQAKITRIIIRNCDLTIDVAKIEKLRSFLNKHTNGLVVFTFKEKPVNEGKGSN